MPGMAEIEMKLGWVIAYVDDPAAAAGPEHCPQLGRADGMRTGVRPDVAEAEDVQVPATTRHGRQARDVIAPLVAVEGVEQAAIEHGVEHPVQAVEMQR